MPLYRVTVEQMIADWKSKPQEVARRMLAKYGLPHEATPMRLIWHQTGPWKRTEVVNEEIQFSQAARGHALAGHRLPCAA
jgi:hypothetical protein